jgi:hypothetical protein
MSPTAGEYAAVTAKRLSEYGITAGFRNAENEMSEDGARETPTMATETGSFL